MKNDVDNEFNYYLYIRDEHRKLYSDLKEAKNTGYKYLNGKEIWREMEDLESNYYFELDDLR